VGFRRLRRALFISGNFFLQSFMHFFRHIFSAPGGITATNRSLPCSQFSVV
jgi:hypothetical protein